MRIPGVAQSCSFGNKAERVIVPHGNTNQQIGKEISRLMYFTNRPPTGLLAKSEVATQGVPYGGGLVKSDKTKKIFFLNGTCSFFYQTWQFDKTL